MDDAPTFIHLSKRISVARKAYKCDLCNSGTKVFESYEHSTYTEDGQFKVGRRHVYNCYLEEA